MVLLESASPKEAIYYMHPILVDENHHEITDTLVGTGPDAYYQCELLFYDDFLANRKERLKTNHWYQYDTVYGFAEGKYVARYNYCKYIGKKIYLRYTDRHTADLRYHYIEIPENKRIHLHEYSNLLYNQNNAELKKQLEPFLIKSLSQ